MANNNNHLDLDPVPPGGQQRKSIEIALGMLQE
jgi:hypothetical protein